MSDKETLQERIDGWKERGKREDEITYGMLCDGFQSLRGIPDEFYSAEDPADRVRLWEGYQLENERESYRARGRCWRCGRETGRGGDCPCD